MRSVGTNTAAAIAAGVFTPRMRASVWDESGNELAIPPEAIAAPPRVDGQIPRIGWRASIRILETGSMDGWFLRGRTFQAWEIFYPGEDLSLFKGEISDVKQAQTRDEQGVLRWTYDLTVDGVSTRPLEGQHTRYQWAPTPTSIGDALEANTNPVLTAIVRGYPLTLTYTHDATAVTTTANATATTITMASTAAFSAGDTIFILKGHFCEKTKIASLTGTVLTLESSQALTQASYFPTGSTVRKVMSLVPLNSVLFFPGAAIETYVQAWNGGTTYTASVDYTAAREVKSGLLMLQWLNTPGSGYTIRVYVVERWVYLTRRSYHNGVSKAMTAGYYAYLSGDPTDSTREILADQTTTTVRADKTHTSAEVWLTDPQCCFASSSVNTRWLSVWISGTEYRGKVSSVDKTGGANHGQVLFDASYPLRNSAGTAATLAGGETAANTSTWYYEILAEIDPHDTVDPSNNRPAIPLRAEPMGGYWLYGTKDTMASWVIPGYDPTTRDAGTGEFTVASDLGKWHGNNASSRIIAQGSGSDVAAFLAAFFTAIGVTTYTLADTGYTLAPFTRAQVTGTDLLQGVRTDTLPPNYVITEDEAGGVVGAYISQDATADLDLGRVTEFKPRELPKAASRVIVKGKTNQINRAGQFLNWATFTSIDNPARLFSGYATDRTLGSLMTYIGASVIFEIPASEPGRYPLVDRVTISNAYTNDAFLSGNPAAGGAGTWLWTPRGLVPGDAGSAFTKRDHSYLLPMLRGLSTPEGRCFLFVDFYGSGYLDEIEIWANEGPYWEATFTDDTSKAPANNGAGNFGSTWNQPDRTLRMSYRYVPVAYRKRSMANYAAGLDRTITIEQEGITQAQARQLGEATLDAVLRGAEFYDCTATYDPRLQLGDTVSVTYLTYPGGVATWVQALYLVWAIVKEGKVMRLTLANYAR